MSRLLHAIVPHLIVAFATRVRILLCTLCYFSLLQNTLAQNITNRGREFWVGYGHHQFMEPGGDNSQNMTIYLSAEDQAAEVTVEIYGMGIPTIPSTWWKRTYNIAPYTVIDIETTTASTYSSSAGAIGAIPKSGAQDARLYTDPPPMGTGGAGTFNKKGIHITSNVPIVAYAHIYGSMSSGATMLLPVEAWGYSYVSLNSLQSYSSNCYNWMYVIASKDNTVIEITPSVKTRAQNQTGLQPGVSKQITLMKGQIYQVIGANLTSDADGNGGTSSDGYELSGTKVRSLAHPSTGECFPIAVFAGSSRTANDASCGSGGGDNDNQQLFPQHAWGKRYLTAPFSGSSNPASFGTSTYKVAVMDPTTVVKKNGAPLTGLSGNYYRFESNTADFIEADKPIMVTQFMTGGSCLGAGGLGDPEMVVVAPVEQAIRNVGFYRNTKESIDVNYVTMVVPTAGLGTVKIDNMLLSAHPAGSVHTYNHPQNGQPGLLGRPYTVVVKRWGTASKSQALIQCDSPFNAITYGLGSVESYAYSAGAFINNLNFITGLNNVPANTPGAHHVFTGVNTPFRISLLLRYIPTKITWRFSQKSPATTLSSLSNGVAPEINIATDFIMSPASDYYVDAPTINGVKYYRYSLPDSFIASAAGIISIPVTVESPGIENCGSIEQLISTINVVPQPVAAISLSHDSRCTKDTIRLGTPQTAASGSSQYPISKWNWRIDSVGGGVTVFTDTLQNEKLVLPPGQYQASMHAITADGLLVITPPKTFTVFDIPSATIDATPDTLCLGQSTVLTQQSAYGGGMPINHYWWDIGDGTMASATAWSDINKVYPALGVYQLKFRVGVSPLCQSDTAFNTVVVDQEAYTNVVLPVGCLPPNGLAGFNAGTTAQGGMQITAYEWNFGDPASGAENTSGLQNPSHQFSTPGNYQVVLHIVTSNGCTGTDTMAVQANVRAALAFGNIAPVCKANDSLGIAFASVTNNIPGVGYYYDPSGATSYDGKMSLVTAPPGTDTVWFVYTTTTGCTDSVWQTVEVRATPTASFIIADAEICVDDTAYFTSTSGIVADSISSLTWDFDNGIIQTTANTSAAMAQVFATHRVYQVKLKATSNRNCVSEEYSAALTVDPVPVAAFDMPPFVCMPGGLVQFINHSSIANGEALYYGWDFGDPASGSANVSLLKDGAHEYADSGNYDITLIVESGKGCNVTLTQSFNRFFNKPVAAFDVAPDTVCQGTANVFSDHSFAPGSNIATWRWMFGDGTTESTVNPVKTYSSPGSYTVVLQVTNTQGCEAEYSSSVEVYLQPKVHAGPAYVVAAGTLVTLNPQVNAPGLQLEWTSPGGAILSNSTILNPVYQADRDAVFILTATADGGCSDSDSFYVRVLHPVSIQNAFSPNGDGVNDTWTITHLADYPRAVIEVYNRFGQRVYRSFGYQQPWDGTANGKDLPPGTYYYIVDPKDGFPKLTGYVVLLR